MKRGWWPFVLACLVSHLLFAEDRVYVTPEQLVFEKNRLFIATPHSFLPLTKLNYDKDGFYFYLKDLSSLSPSSEWICQVCNHPNWAWQIRCTECHSPLP